MKSLQRLKTVLSDVEINEEQKAALDEFLSELTESIKSKLEAEYEDKLQAMVESSSAPDLTGYVKIEEAEAAYELAMEDAERAFDLAMEDAEAAFNAVQEDIIAESSEVMSKTIEDLYEGLLDKAREEVLESPQFEVLSKIKGLLAPHIIEENSSNVLLQKVKDLEEQIKSINEEKEELEREKIIESLVSELPKKEAKIVRSYIEEAESVDSIYERFNLAISLLEAKQDGSEKESDSDEDLDEDEQIEVDEEEELDEEEEVSESVVSEEVIEETKQSKRKKFDSIEEAIMANLWG